MAIYKTSAYAPIACITSRDESNATNSTEKTNVCTEGKTVTRPNSITRTVSLAGEIVNENSYEDLLEAQNSLEEQTFRIYRGSGDANPVYFKAVISNLSASFDAATEGADGTFSMDLNINGDYLDEDPEIGG